MLLLTLACGLGCFDGSNALVGPRHVTAQDSVTPPAARIVTGSATVAINVDRARSIATAEISATRGTLVPQLDGAIEYDANRGVVRLPLALRNDGRLRIHAPADISGDASVTSAPVHFANPDLVAQSGRPKWTYDRYLGASPTSSTHPMTFVAPHTVSQLRWIEIAVPPTESSFQTTLAASGTIVFTIAPRAVTTTSDSVLHQAETNVFAHNEMPGRVTRDVLWLVFKPTATIEDRQEALDAVDGTVVGGSLLQAGNNYLIRIPTTPDAGAGPLLRALETVQKLPQVRFAFTNRYDRLTPMYL
jgi:hypothetical protein